MMRCLPAEKEIFSRNGVYMQNGTFAWLITAREGKGGGGRQQPGDDVDECTFPSAWLPW